MRQFHLEIKIIHLHGVHILYRKHILYDKPFLVYFVKVHFNAKNAISMHLSPLSGCYSTQLAISPCGLLQMVANVV